MANTFTYRPKQYRIGHIGRILKTGGIQGENHLKNRGASQKFKYMGRYLKG